MRGASEIQKPLAMERKDIRGLRKRREPQMHQRVAGAVRVRRTFDHEIMIVVGLKVPKRYPRRLIAMDRDEVG